MARFAVAPLVFLIAAASAAPVTGAGDPAFGYWQTANGGAIVEIAACAEGACGDMVWMRQPTDEAGAPRLDSDGRPLCGLTLVSGLKQTGTGQWERGEIVDPRSGTVYSAEVSVLDPEHLEVRGYVLSTLFGKSQIWTRTTSDRGGCLAG
ncbi:MAG: DUF2147 domain-containing protein [Pseudomonadota bacterium]